MNTDLPENVRLLLQNEKLSAKDRIALRECVGKCLTITNNSIKKADEKLKRQKEAEEKAATALEEKLAREAKNLEDQINRKKDNDTKIQEA